MRLNHPSTTSNVLLSAVITSHSSGNARTNPFLWWFERHGTLPPISIVLRDWLTYFSIFINDRHIAPEIGEAVDCESWNLFTTLRVQRNLAGEILHCVTQAANRVNIFVLERISTLFSRLINPCLNLFPSRTRRQSATNEPSHLRTWTEWWLCLLYWSVGTHHNRRWLFFFCRYNQWPISGR